MSCEVEHIATAIHNSSKISDVGAARAKIDHLLIKADESIKKKIVAAAGLAMIRQELKE